MKTIKVIESCKTLNQLKTAWEYVKLEYGTTGDLYQFQLNADAYREKLRQMSGAITKNLLDYKAYAQHLLQHGKIEDAQEFLQFSELELDKLEGFL